MAAGKVLKNFERTVIRKSKMEGYDGGDSDSSVQWNFSGALLYSVTVISTIGRRTRNLNMYQELL